MKLLYLLIEMSSAVVASYLFTRLLIHYSIRYSLLDDANNRSSHKHPTPRIGGISFIVIISLLILTHYFLDGDNLSKKIYATLLIPPLIVSFISVIDDIKGGISRILRMICHISAVVFAFYLLGFSISTTWALIGALILVIGVTWIINLYNFMDGIDGIAAAEAIFILSASAGITFSKGYEDWASMQLSFTAPIIGFLLLNWQPAKTFMGDVGSTFLGTLLSIVLIINVMLEALPIWSCIILFGVFIVDASWTLFYRLASAQKWYHPHRSHAYQILSRKLGSHAKVSLGIAGVNIVWLLPLSYVASVSPEHGFIITVIAMLPLIVFCALTGAGKLTSN